MENAVERMTRVWNARFGGDRLYLTPTRLLMAITTLLIAMMALCGVVDMALTNPTHHQVPDAAARDR